MIFQEWKSLLVFHVFQGFLESEGTLLLVSSLNSNFNFNFNFNSNFNKKSLFVILRRVKHDRDLQLYLLSSTANGPIGFHRYPCRSLHQVLQSLYR